MIDAAGAGPLDRVGDPDPGGFVDLAGGEALSLDLGAPRLALFHREERAAGSEAGQDTAKGSWKRNATQHVRKIRRIPERKS